MKNVCSTLYGLIVVRRNLRLAIEAFKDALSSRPAGTAWGLLRRVEAVENDYLLMRGFMAQGYDDEQRERLYGRGLRQLYGIFVDFVTGGYHELRKLNEGDAGSVDGLDFGALRQMMEGYVQDVAMAGLGAPSVNVDSDVDGVRSRHAADMASAFDAVVSSRCWDAATADEATDVLLSPAVEAADAALLVSAVMLALGRCFDYWKWKTLTEIYRRSDDVVVRQRAFVGWMLMLPGRYHELHEGTAGYHEFREGDGREMLSLFPEMGDDLRNLFGDEHVRREALELQMQVVYCRDAEADSEQIRRDIMPGLLRNSDFRITRNGIEEVEDDPMQDILNPGAADKAAEEVESAVRQMAEMQRRGADVFFGGFRQMKRFPFFFKECNWFMPFSVDHPALRDVRARLGESGFLKMLLERGPFCDSDKYSFALVMARVADGIPANMREMLGSEEAFGPMETAPERRSAAWVRRMFLQDVYRYWRLKPPSSPKKEGWGAVKHPFASDCHSPVLGGFAILTDVGLERELAELERFFYKQKRYEAVVMLNFNFNDNKANANANANANAGSLLCGWAMLHLRRFAEARAVFERLVNADGDDENAARRGLAQAAFALRDYVTAERELALTSSAASAGSAGLRGQLLLAIAKLHNGKIAEGMNLLYKLDLENPENGQVRRALAWGLLLQGRCEQADAIYERILAGDDCVPDDFLNAGYAKWFTRKISDAVDCFRRFIEKSGTVAADDFLARRFAEDDVLLCSRGIGGAERMLMRDLVASVSPDIS